MTELRPELQEALASLHSGARVETLAGDASTRRFHRLHLAEGGTRIVMDYGSPFSGETDDVRLARIFERAALPVARVLDVVEGAGCLLLEDLGDVTLEQALTRGVPEGRASRGDLHGKAIELAAAVATRGTEALSRSDRSAGPALDLERFRFEMGFFVEHFLQGYRRSAAPSSSLVPALDALAQATAAHPRVMCHRDFHSRNLMVRGDGSLVMVDIQDARWGPDTYDVASLLRDAYVDLEEAEVERLFDRYVDALPGDPDRGSMRQRFHLVSTQRMIKALGTFGYQIARLGRQRYSEAVLRTIERLKRSLAASPDTVRLDAALRESGVYS